MSIVIDNKCRIRKSTVLETEWLHFKIFTKFTILLFGLANVFFGSKKLNQMGTKLYHLYNTQVLPYSTVRTLNLLT